MKSNDSYEHSTVLPAERWLWLGTFVACLIVNAWFSSIGWDHNLIEGHQFRQTQTALTAHYLKTEGWTAAYPFPLFGPPWSAPMEFPFYQWCVAQVSKWTGYPLESCGRGVALTFFYLTLPALFLLTGRLNVPAARRWLFLALVVVSPIYIYYSRAFMIESTALCASAWFLQTFCAAVETRRPSCIALALLLGCIAALAKPTTFAVFLVPALAFTVSRVRPSLGSKLQSQWPPLLIGGALIAAAVVAGMAWVQFGDRVKAANPLSRFLVSDNLQAWNFGSLEQRFSLPFWTNIFRISGESILPTASVVAFVFFALFLGRDYRKPIAMLIGCYLAGPLLFANLYLVHDYYFYATGIFLLAAMLLAWCQVLNLPQVSFAGKCFVIAATLVAQGIEYSGSYKKLQARPDDPKPELGEVIAAITSPEDVILIYGQDWNPLLSYYSGRKAVMIIEEFAKDIAARDATLARIEPGRIAALVITGHLRGENQFISELTSKYEFLKTPLLRGSDTDLYLAERLISPAVPVIKALLPAGFTLNAPPDAQVDGIQLWRFLSKDGAKTAQSAGFSPVPSEYLTPFGVTAIRAEGHTVLNAHAPTNITLEVPPGATIIEGYFGLLAEAYSDSRETDGVSFRVEWLADDGSRYELFGTMLRPQSDASDRGRKRFEVKLPARSSKDLILLHTDPGPAKNNSFDWAYWSDVRIH